MHPPKDFLQFRVRVAEENAPSVATIGLLVRQPIPEQAIRLATPGGSTI